LPAEVSARAAWRRLHCNLTGTPAAGGWIAAGKFRHADYA